MSATVSLTESAVFTALRAYILTLIPCEVIRSLGNGVPTPVGGFIALTTLSQTRLSTNVDSYADTTPTTGTKSAQQAIQYSIQIDCYGPLSGDWAAILSTLLRDEASCIALGPDVQPLDADDPKNMPIVNGEQQYVARWIVTALLQANPVVATPMQFFTSATVGLIDVDTNYPA